ncbi:cytochrome P450 87A3-like [Papaver somniferum]|uniref:cytochrome P450 87A3-like n=1 Tax=Papaver somniferum TaxID=3469 RepID=UPI000E7047DF|nr:cytochrome P450 87A3-like [Papaver somniferum]
MLVPVSLCIGTLIIICITHWVYRWRNPRCNGKLPPGSMGFPFIGETHRFFTPTTSSDIPPFMKERMERYGPVFKTSLVRQSFIVSTDREVNHMIMSHQEGQSFEFWYPETVKTILGQASLLTLNGSIHRYIWNMVLSLVGPESLKQKLLPHIVHGVKRNLLLWGNQDTVDLKEAVSKMIFELTARKLISYEYDPTKPSENLRECFAAFNEGLISFPLDIPGTAYHKCLQGRKHAMKILKAMLQERRKIPKSCPEDFFDHVLDELKNEGTKLTEAIGLDLMFLLLFASLKTTSISTTFANKLLTENPAVLEELTEEKHDAIIRSRKNEDAQLTWKEYKSTKFTIKVINESVRLANIVPGVFRKALKDVHIKGYTIPAGWAVMLCIPSVHLNPSEYKDPLEFNPHRWDGVELNGGTKDFMAFGAGQRFCVGTDFAKLQMAVFLHFLVTKYKWKTIKGGDITRIPGVTFPNGFHIKISEKNT